MTLARRPRVFRGWARWLVLVLQVALFCLPLQATGVLHALTDVVVSAVGEKVHHGNPPCSHEENGERCPPGCPDCHCVLSLPALPPSPMTLTVRVVSSLSIPEMLPNATAPPHPPLSSIERPPRNAHFA